jgi:hypothetical protein
MADKFRHGTAKGFQGMYNPNAKLLDSDIFRIRQLIKEGQSPRAIAQAFGVSDVMIYLIRNGKAWSHI